jgi:hypothetical protein
VLTEFRLSVHVLFTPRRQTPPPPPREFMTHFSFFDANQCRDRSNRGFIDQWWVMLPPSEGLPRMIGLPTYMLQTPVDPTCTKADKASDVIETVNQIDNEEK